MSQRRQLRPSVTIHYAQTLDGRIATRTGSSRWISCGDSLTLAHELRAEHEAVMVGVGTVLKDNPALTVRRAAGRSPARIVLDSTLRTPLDSQVLRGGGPPTLLATTDRARPDAIQSLAEKGAELLVVPENSGRQVDLEVLLDQLQQRGLRSILVEGGATLITNMLRANLVDRLVVCIAPKILGTGIEAVGELDIRDLSRALTFTRSSFMACDEDVIFDGLMRQGEAAEQ